jgi:hypothetical protein
MNDVPSSACPRTDAVLAVHLDGDLLQSHGDELGYAFVCGDALREHLLDCRACQTALRRARRLDAALAAAAGAALERHPGATGTDWGTLARRWFAAIDGPPPAAVPTALAAPSRDHALWLRVAGAAAAATAIAAALLACWWPGAVVAGRAPDAALAVLRPPAAPPSMAVDPTAAQRLRARAARPSAHARPASLRALADRLDDAAAPVDERLAAATALLQLVRTPGATGAAAFEALLTATAAADDRGEGASRLRGLLLELWRQDAPARTSLANALELAEAARQPWTDRSRAAVFVAARLGTTLHDGLLQRLARRQPAAIDTIAEALRRDGRAGAARLLLDLWSDAAARARVEDAAVAARWFADQSTAMTRELLREFEASRHSDRRLRCLLALGHARDATPVPLLLARLRSGHYHEAHVAAFALAHLPPEVLAPLATAGGHFLLRAALARADVPAARPWIDELRLAPHERSLLHDGPLDGFPEVASWFRERVRHCD